VSAIGDALALWSPAAYWTIDYYVRREVVVALLCVIASLEIGRAAMQPALLIWLRACRWVWPVLIALAGVGLHGLETIASSPCASYRGLLVLDAAVAGVLAVVLIALMLYELPHHPLHVTALTALLRYFMAQVVYLGAWEASRTVAPIVGLLASATYIWAMLAIARAAILSERWPRTAQALRASR
jgi:hypothetical protein